LLFAAWAMPTIGTMIQAGPGVDLDPDLNVYLFLAIVTLLTGVGAGLAPAWHGRGVDLVTPLKGEVAGQHRMAPKRLQSLLVMTQTAASVLLVVMAALFVRATVRAAAIDVGFDATGLHAVYLDGFDEDGARRRDFWARAIAELQAVPGVTAVSLAELTPFGAGIRTAIARDAPARVVHLNRTDAGYFETVGLRLLAGRTFTRDEIAAKAPVALVSESLARTYWPDRSPLGQMLPQEIPVEATRPMVIGVVSDAITARLREPSAFAVYEPLDPDGERFARLLIRVSPDTTPWPERAERVEGGVIDRASQRLRAIDPEADLSITSVGARLRQATNGPRVLATLTGIVGAIAIVLCVIGLYGLTASVVGQRAREMGVRVAMGAERRDLLRLLMRDSLRPVVLGLAVGGGVALLAGRVVEAAMFFGVPPHDPMALAGAAVILLAAATLAVLIPTRRAAAVDAALVLRRS
jgi:predicted permease